jgi:hypothetical protein
MPAAAARWCQGYGCWAVATHSKKAAVYTGDCKECRRRGVRVSRSGLCWRCFEASIRRRLVAPCRCEAARRCIAATLAEEGPPPGLAPPQSSAHERVVALLCERIFDLERRLAAAGL